MNKEYKYLSDRQGMDPKVLKRALKDDPSEKGLFDFSVSLRFIEMMFIQGADNLVDKVSRAIFDLRNGDLSKLQILQVEQNDPKYKFFNAENCAYHAILEVDLGREYDNGDQKKVFLPIELYLSPYYNSELT